jgi:hypothetical protein
MNNCTLNEISMPNYYAVYLSHSAVLPSAIFVCLHCAYSFLDKHAGITHRIETLNANLLANAIKHCPDIIKINNTDNSTTRRTLDEVKLNQ